MDTTFTMQARDADAVALALDDWRLGGKVLRLWKKDASLWTGRDEKSWLGWLDLGQGQEEHTAPMVAFADELRREGVAHVVVLGMGGSSLCPWVMARTFAVAGAPALHVLDSVVPAQIRAVERAIELDRTLFVVSSKSGTTTEPDALRAYFMDRVRHAVDLDAPGRHFVAITDPGTELEAVAQRDGYRDVFAGHPSVGGRYSALSAFGMVPAALMGADVSALRASAAAMARACDASVPPADNPGVALGVALGTLARAGRDKLTIVTSPPVRALGAWLEQLIAESTGKDGRGIVPIDDEQLGPPDVYRDDRAFVYVRTERGADPAQDAAIAALADAGHPVVQIGLGSAHDLGGELFRWEIATAVAGSILGVNAFDQPDVEASKRATAALIASGARDDAGASPPREDELAAHLAQLRPGDYLAICAFLEMNDEHHRALQAIRHVVRDRRRVATTLGYGPRFLHSTGQLHKGGPATGVFLQLTADDAEDLAVPGRPYTFGALTRAQAAGDLQVLRERRRRALRVHLGRDVAAGLATLHKLVDLATLPS